jgi:ribosomal protein S27AE
MPSSTPQRLAGLRNLLATKPHLEVLRVYLHQKQNDLLKEAVLVAIHRNWSARPPYGLTEIGITTYARQLVNCGLPLSPGPHAEELLQNVYCIHLRIRSHAHLSSPDSNPDAYHFGTSIYVTHAEALEMLDQIWHQPIDHLRLEEGFRPVICLSYRDNEGVAKVRRADFDFIPADITTTIAVLNVQNIAFQAKITSSPDATLEYLLPIFKIKPYDTGNGGNAAMYSTVIALLSVLRDEIYGAKQNPRAKPGQKGLSASKPAQDVMQWLMERPTPAPPFGATTYCWRCGSFMHAHAECPNTDIVCGKCERSNAQWRQKSAWTHREGLCVYH